MPELDGERAMSLAGEALARFDVDGAVAHLSAAVRAFSASGDACRGAMACVRLGDVYANALGNLTASRAWFARARRLVEDQPPCLEQGWVAVAAMGCDVDDPAALLAAAELALDRARRFGDVNLETKALADGGLAHVQAGRLAQGMAMLDEAMALACGTADDMDAAARSVCSFFTACYHAGDYQRAGSWADLLRRHRLISLEPGGPVFLSSHCDSVQAALLVELGRWSEAEALLTRAQSHFEAAMHQPSWHPDIALAELRIRQGRLGDAEALLLGKEQSLQALIPAARLHLARGDHELASSIARRGLRLIGDDRLRAVELLTIVVDAELGAGNLDAAIDASATLAARSSGLDVPALHARAAAARARYLIATGATTDAVTTLEEAVDAVAPTDLAWLHGTLLLELARLRELAGDRTGAAVDARAAAGALARLDVAVDPQDLALLARLGAGPDGSPRTATLSLHGKGWLASYAGTSVPLRDTRGLRFLAALLAEPGVERHVLDLVDRVEGVPPDAAAPTRRALGDAGAVLDAQARNAYRHRVEHLRAEIDEALAAGLLETAESAQDEHDRLVAELARAFGLGGRDRRAASAVERARLNVTRAVRAATSRLSDALPEAGATLDRRVRTGIYCAYEPDETDGIFWVFSRD